MLGNSYRNRPDIQARSIANSRNPEWVRHEQVIRDTKGMFLGHFKKKVLARQWQGEWVRAGKPSQPHDLPEFPAWLEAKREELTLQRDREREERRMFDVFHDDWLAKGRPDGERTFEEKLALVEVFRSTGHKKVAHVTGEIADRWQDYYQRSAGKASSPSL